MYIVEVFVSLCKDTTLPLSSRALLIHRTFEREEESKDQKANIGNIYPAFLTLTQTTTHRVEETI